MLKTNLCFADKIFHLFSDCLNISSFVCIIFSSIFTPQKYLCIIQIKMLSSCFHSAIFSSLHDFECKRIHSNRLLLSSRYAMPVVYEHLSSTKTMSLTTMIMENNDNNSENIRNAYTTAIAITLRMPENMCAWGACVYVALNFCNVIA